MRNGIKKRGVKSKPQERRGRSRKLAQAKRGGPSHSRQSVTGIYILLSGFSLAFSLLVDSPFSLFDFAPLDFSAFSPFVFSPFSAAFSVFSDFTFSSFIASAAKAAEERNMEAINTPRKRFISNPPCGLLLVLLKRKTILPPSARQNSRFSFCGLDAQCRVFIHAGAGLYTNDWFAQAKLLPNALVTS